MKKKKVEFGEYLKFAYNKELNQLSVTSLHDSDDHFLFLSEELEELIDYLKKIGKV